MSEMGTVVVVSVQHRTKVVENYHLPVRHILWWHPDIHMPKERTMVGIPYNGPVTVLTPIEKFDRMLGVDPSTSRDGYVFPKELPNDLRSPYDNQRQCNRGS